MIRVIQILLALIWLGITVLAVLDEGPMPAFPQINKMSNGSTNNYDEISAAWATLARSNENSVTTI